MRRKIFNTYVDCLSMNESLEKIIKMIEEKSVSQHVVINASKINLMSKDQKLTKIVNGCPLINADGASILIAGKLLNIDIPERVTGIDLFYELLKISEERGYKPYFLGATKESVEAMIQNIRKKHPNLNIAGYRNGYFNNEDESNIIKEIKNSSPDILFLGFSSPQKEYWLNRNLSELNIPFSMGVGGSFDVLSGKTQRAPIWMQKIGMEWFYRFLQEPKRMFSRYFLGNFRFLILCLKELNK